MSGIPKHGGFRIDCIKVQARGRAYETYEVSGYLSGRRIRRRSRSQDEAQDEKSRLEVRAANSCGEIQAINTRLSRDQVIQAEIAFSRLGPTPIKEVVDWWAATYKPATANTGLGVAEKAFIADRAKHVREPTLRDYRRSLATFCAAFPGRNVNTITTDEVQEFLSVRYPGKKRFNNVRSDLNAFFAFCIDRPRVWLRENSSW